jgi:hypothetical protein
MAKNEDIGFVVTTTESGNVQIKDTWGANITLTLYPQEVLFLHQELGKYLDLDKPSTPIPPPDEL